MLKDILFWLLIFLSVFCFIYLATHVEAQEPLCNGGRFQPCICTKDVPKLIRYSPSLKECKGNAGAILHGKYRSIFSIVLRNSENSDREPKNFGNCTQLERENGESKCSAYKVQKRFNGSFKQRAATFFCFGLPGNKPVMKAATRLTLKIKDDPFSNNDPLLRVCLKRGDKPLNF